jgi:hypothetical protein
MFLPKEVDGSIAAATAILISPDTILQQEGLTIDPTTGNIPAKKGDVFVATFPVMNWTGLSDISYAVAAYRSDGVQDQTTKNVKTSSYSSENETIMIVKRSDGYVRLYLVNSNPISNLKQTVGSVSICHVAKITGGGGGASNSPIVIPSSGISSLRANDIDANDYIEISMTFVKWEPISIEIIGVSKFEIYGRWNDSATSIGVTAPTGVEVTPLGGGSIRIRNTSGAKWYGNLIKVTYRPSAVTLTRNTPA